ncbi:MAG: NAD-dependent epimerase/dehydratase family protein [Pseudomonadota bacterium]
MACAFVTGATGFLGRNLVFELSRRGWKTHALVRDPKSRAAQAISHLRGLSLVQGDVTVAHSLVKATPENVDVVFHCAADTSTWSGHKRRQNTVNIEGTRNIIYATYEAKAQVLVHVSTSSVYGIQKVRPYSENAHKIGFRSSSNYIRSKLAAEHAIYRAVERGLDAVVVNPGQILGRFDTNNWATLIRMTDNGTLPGIPPGSGCFAHAAAVCDAMIRAAEVGKSGENYLLGGPHASFEEVIALIAQQLGKEPPSKIIPGWVLSSLGRWNTLKAAIRRQEPGGLTREAAAFMSIDDHFVSDKAIKDLGYTPPPLDELVRDAVAWQASEKMVSGAGVPALVLGDLDADPEETAGAGCKPGAPEAAPSVTFENLEEEQPSEASFARQKA